ncbi:MAG: exonuclease domain-containing protein [Clostridia bacterium]
MDFISVDFETPNRKNNAICAMGITFVKDKQVVFNRLVYVKPTVPFDKFNTKLHGISADTVATAPDFLAVWNEYRSYFNHYPVVMHNCSFDTSVLYKEAKRFHIDLPPLDVYCTYRLYKSNYPEYEKHSLNALASRFDIELNHHCCGSDSLAAAKLMMRLLDDESTCIFSSNAVCYNPKDQPCEQDEEPLEELNNERNKQYAYLKGGTGEFTQPICNYNDESIEFYANHFCFTGSIDGYSRTCLKDIIIEKQGFFSNHINTKTNYLIVGVEDIGIVGRDGRSQKIIDAEALIYNGVPIRIVKYTHFIEELKNCSVS